ncbi:MAG: peptidylprolyl isomerase, partial [Actinobacteria bacterium]|nr:peptidylprolyl isomerase [Actinomycetota bacterium]
MCIDANKRYTAEMVTSKGTLTIALDPIAAPKTVNNFVVLARYHYYDGIVFHRVIPGFVLQGGDPEGTGRGG